ncbi:unnamed protein product [Periconia digitata]|uniref:Isochorismatase-like domain-containing protein n=1 Tax=Periconia digitata TaxID=1303443 RepID=A0A9W4U791_9PLEO|nr:unnamed protein product [Periconia digitata]
MHKSTISPAALSRPTYLRGTNAPLPLDPKKTAHLIIDLQTGFMQPSAMLEIPTARAIVPNVNLITQTLRAAGGSNIYLQYTYDEHEANTWSSHYGRMTPAARERIRAAFTRGGEQHALFPLLDVDAVDRVLEKTRWSAFTPGTCSLDRVLKESGVDTLIVTGTTTNICVESTVREAMQLGYHVVVVVDGCAARTDELHNASLENMCLFGDVVDCAEVVKRIREGVVEG